MTNVSGHEYVALIHPTLMLHAHLELLLLRPENPGSIISQSGDIDNQLKRSSMRYAGPVCPLKYPAAGSQLTISAPYTACLKTTS